MATASTTTPGRTNSSNPKLSGYRGTANLMGSYPELAIFRRFMNATALDLLYRQAELQIKIQNWNVQAAADATDTAGAELPNYGESFVGLLDSFTHEDPKRGQQRRMWLEISPKLESYHEALFRFQKLCNLPTADERHLSLLRLHLNSSEQGAEYMKSFEGTVYQDLDHPKIDPFISADLTSILKTEQEDKFTKFVRGPLLDFYHDRVGIDRKENIKAIRVGEDDVVEYPLKVYNKDWAFLTVGLLYALLTSCLITAAVLLLNYIDSSVVRIVLIVICNLSFTVAMAVFVKGKPKDFFAVAAAYAAVLVVFATNPPTTAPSTKT